MNPEPQTGSNKNHIVLYLVLILAVVLVGYFLLMVGIDGTPRSSDRVEVAHADLSSDSAVRIPLGFPSNIPLEEQNIKESYSVNYLDEGVTQFTVAYNSDFSREEILKIYSDFFLASGYTSGDGDRDESKGTIRGWRSGNKLSIAVSPYGEGSYVAINYIRRQESVQ